MSLQTDIDQLKTTMLQTTQFNVAWHAFFDLSMHPEFIERSNEAHLENLKPILEQIGRTLAPDGAIRLQAPLILKYANTDFYHGPLLGAGKTGTFMYFKDSGAGMATLITGEGRYQTQFCRFTLTPVHSPHSYMAPQLDTEQPLVH